MAAFNWIGGCPDPIPEKRLSVKHQPQVHLHNPNELLLEIERSEQSKLDMVYIKNPGKCSGHTCIDLWYAKALHEHLSRS